MTLLKVIILLNASWCSPREAVAYRKSQTGSLGQTVADRKSRTDSPRQEVADGQSQTGSRRRAVPERQSQTGSLGQTVPDRKSQTGSPREAVPERQSDCPSFKLTDDPLGRRHSNNRKKVLWTCFAFGCLVFLVWLIAVNEWHAI